VARVIPAENEATGRQPQPWAVVADTVPSRRRSGSPGHVQVPGTWTRPEETPWRG
jgi:hypothetical protein